MSNEVQELQSLLLLLTRELVQHPEAIEVKSSEQGSRVFLELSCDPSDMGKVIGRGGKRAQAIRTLMKAKASQLGCRVVVDFAG